MRRIRTVAQLRELRPKPTPGPFAKCTRGRDCDKAGRCYQRTMGDVSLCPILPDWSIRVCRGCGYKPLISITDVTVCCPEKQWAALDCPKCHGKGTYPAFTELLGQHTRRCDCDIHQPKG